MGRRRLISTRSVATAMAVAMAYAGMTACAAKAGPSAGAAVDGSTSTSGAGAACGTVSYQDPGGSADLKSLPKDVRDGYNGYFAPINESVYKSFKSRKGPYRIGYSDSFAANSWRGDAPSRRRAWSAVSRRATRTWTTACRSSRSPA